MGLISNSGHDENGQYNGGRPGDQTGEEWVLREWYSCPWSCVLRHPNAQIRATMATLAIKAAQNDHIGYNQGNRTSYWSELQKVNYDPSAITTNCDDDCSAGVCANVKAAGFLCNDTKLQGIEITSTYYMRNMLRNAGFEVFTDSSYTASDANLVPGDILLKDNQHTAMYVGNGDASALPTGGGTGAMASLGIGTYEYEDYTVQEGDTIYSIAAKFGVTPAMIMFANNLQSSVLQPGQSIKIPQSKNGLENPEEGTEPIQKKHTRGISVSHPVIEIQFYTEQGLLAVISTVGMDTDTEFDSDLISATTNRDMGQDCPTFSLNLVWRNNWYYALASNDLVVIKMQRPPEPKRTVFIGLIDDIRKSTDFSSGQPQRAVQVTGRGLSKAFVTYTVGLLENLSIDTGTGFFADLVNLASCDSYDAIDLVQTSYVDRAVRYSFSDGSTLGDHYQYTGNHHEGETLTDYQSYTQYNGSLWNFMKELNNTPFNELYWEIEDEKATLIHRRTPFNKNDWIELERIEIPDTDIVSDNTGRSDLETYTVYAVNPKLGSETLVNMYLPLWYPPFASKYGISQLTAETAYQTWGSAIGSTGALSGNGGMSGTPGSTVEIPEPYGGGGYTVTYYDNSDNSWNWDRQSDSGNLYYNYWEPGGKEFTNGIATLNGCYLIACTSTYGKVGDKILWTLDDGTTIPTIMADTKNPSDAGYNQYGHSNGQNVLEFEVSKSYMRNQNNGGNPGTGSWFPEWGGKRVVKAANYGSIFS